MSRWSWILLVLWSALANAEVDLLITHLAQPCHKSCIQGGCKYERCTGAKCPGGACLFVDSTRSSCSGGACLFRRSSRSTCEGGGCDFENPKDTLKRGYCTGGGCQLHGSPHPDFSEFLSV